MLFGLFECEGLPLEANINVTLFKRATYRSCTDVFCALIFFINIVITVVVGIYSYNYGDFRVLINGHDSFGNICGMENTPIPHLSLSGQNMTSKPYIYYFKPLLPLHSTTVCVDKCPDGNTTLDFEFCIPLTNSSNMNRGRCPDEIFPTKTVITRCVPVKAFNFVLKKLKSIDLLEEVYGDVLLTYPNIMGLIVLSILLSIIILFIIRYVAYLLVYVICFAFTIGSIAGIVAIWKVYFKEKEELQKALDTQDYVPQTDIDFVDYILVFAIFITVFGVVLFLVTLTMFSRLRLVVALFYEASRVLSAMTTLLSLPFYLCASLFVVIAYFGCLFILVNTTGEFRKLRANSPDSKFVINPDAKYYDAFLIFSFIWCLEFVIASYKFIIAFAVAKWYFAEYRSRVTYPITKGLVCLLKNHIGTIAFGSLIITLFKIPRLILIYIQTKLKNNTNQLAIMCLKCLTCVLYCFEQVIKFLNDRAYIITAITGKPFLPSAKQALTILVSNALRVATLNSIGDFILFLGKISVAFLTAAIGILWLKDNESLTFFFLPGAVSAVFGFLIACCLFDVYQMVLSTLLMCICYDLFDSDCADGASRNVGSIRYSPRFINKLDVMQSDYDTLTYKGRRPLQRSQSQSITRGHMKTPMSVDTV